jgi:hypothetical protein
MITKQITKFIDDHYGKFIIEFAMIGLFMRED